ncbi:hypothetical protein [Senegalia massiliensis]|uniref:Uncharacterized protein n=1 Tax=Senegalia massiliensis TaxID=1720316 RepID=A0A845QZJ1_9CLOT|nr:hypothetical protein [Senegalia massiliensis]NBI08377.1 hypothetical protein [Senegalia massiliensis]
MGVIVLEFWNENIGAQDYLDKLECLIKGYERKIKLSNYDKNNIIVFSLRYLFSDENWYNYWSLNGNPSVAHLIQGVKNKQDILLKILN